MLGAVAPETVDIVTYMYVHVRSHFGRSLLHAAYSACARWPPLLWSAQDGLIHVNDDNVVEQTLSALVPRSSPSSERIGDEAHGIGAVAEVAQIILQAGPLAFDCHRIRSPRLPQNLQRRLEQAHASYSLHRHVADADLIRLAPEVAETLLLGTGEVAASAAELDDPEASALSFDPASRTTEGCIGAVPKLFALTAQCLRAGRRATEQSRRPSAHRGRRMTILRRSSITSTVLSAAWRLCSRRS